jgi:hypothetical protein
LFKNLWLFLPSIPAKELTGVKALHLNLDEKYRAETVSVDFPCGGFQENVAFSLSSARIMSFSTKSW